MPDSITAPITIAENSITAPITLGYAGPAGPSGADRTVKSVSFTAANGIGYVTTATLTVTDPTGVEGKGYSVLVAAGTTTIGGVAYATAGTIIERVYKSAAWASYQYKDASAFATAAQGTNARTPTAHKASHATGGSDALTPADIGAAAASHTHVSADITDATSEPTEGKVVKYTSEYEGVPYLKADGLFLSDFEITPPEDGQSGGAALPNGCNYPKRFAVTSNTDGQVQYSEIGGTKPSYTASEVGAARAIETKTSDFTAVVGGRYIVESAGKISITDPTLRADGSALAAGDSFECWIGAGTIWFNGAGTVYSASRFSIRRRYTGSAWATPSPVVTDALQVGAMNTWDGSTITGAQTMSGQLQLTGQSATDANSALTRGLADTRYGNIQTIVLASDLTATSTTPVTSTESVVLAAGTYVLSAQLYATTNSTSAGIDCYPIATAGSATYGLLYNRSSVVGYDALTSMATNWQFHVTNAIGSIGTFATGDASASKRTAAAFIPSGLIVVPSSVTIKLAIAQRGGNDANNPAIARAASNVVIFRKIT